MSGPRRRLAHVFATFGAGGPQVRAAQLIAQLGPAWRHVIMAMDGCCVARSQLPDGVEVEFAAPPAPRGFLASARAQRRWLAALGPDLVLTYNWGAIESAVAARRLGLPLVHHEDGFGPEETARRFRRRNWIRARVLRSVPVVVPSRVLAGIARSEWRLADADVHLLPNGVDLARFQPAPRPGAAELVVGTVGGLRGEKDHHTLLEAFAALADPLGVRLRIVGDGALRPELAARAAALGIAARVDFVGAVSDTAPEYRRFHVFVLSSRTEQMPISLLEAMASGCAVVATDVGDVRAMLPERQGAFVVPSGAPAALAEALRTVLTDESLRQELGEANRRRAAEAYELERCLERFAALYRATSA